MKLFVSCMNSCGYSTKHCEILPCNCLALPVNGFCCRGASVHYRYKHDTGLTESQEWLGFCTANVMSPDRSRCSDGECWINDSGTEVLVVCSIVRKLHHDYSHRLRLTIEENLSTANNPERDQHNLWDLKPSPGISGTFLPRWQRCFASDRQYHTPGLLNVRRTRLCGNVAMNRE